MALKAPPSSVTPKKSQTNYFVDTKSNCFLCLQDIPPDPPPLIRLVDGELKVQEPKKKAQQFCLRSIYKLIKIDPSKVVSRIQTTGFLLDTHLFDNTNLTVLLCEDCFQVTQNMSRLCLEQEIIQMKVNHALEEFNKVLQSSSKDPTDRIAGIRRKATDPLDMLNVALAEQMRKETEENCRQLLKKLKIPKVKLSKVTIAPPPLCVPAPYGSPPVPVVISTSSIVSKTPVNFTSLTVIPPLPPQVARKVLVNASYKCKLCRTPFVSTSGLKRHMQKTHPTSLNSSSSVFKMPPAVVPTVTVSLPVKAKVSYTCNQCGIKVHSWGIYQRHKKFYCSFRRNITKAPTPAPAPVSLQERMDSFPIVTLEDNILSCGVCPSSWALKFTKMDVLQTHVITNHADYLFAPMKNPECSESQFKDVCGRVFNTSAQPRRNEDAIGFTFLCAHCSSNYANMTSLRVHLLQVHYSLIASKITTFQSDLLPEPPPPLPVKEPLTRPNQIEQGTATIFKCLTCSAAFKHPRSLRRHKQKTNHDRGVATPKHKSSDVFTCQLCGAQFRHCTSLSRHKKVNHPEKCPPQPPANPNQPIRFKRLQFFCEYCKRGFTTEFFRNMHLERSMKCLKKRQEMGYDVPVELSEAVASNQEFFDEEEEEEMNFDMSQVEACYGETKIEVGEMNHPVTVFHRGEGDNLMTDYEGMGEGDTFLDILQEEQQDGLGDGYPVEGKEDPESMQMFIPEDPLF